MNVDEEEVPLLQQIYQAKRNVQEARRTAGIESVVGQGDDPTPGFPQEEDTLSRDDRVYRNQAVTVLNRSPHGKNFRSFHHREHYISTGKLPPHHFVNNFKNIYLLQYLFIFNLLLITSDHFLSLIHSPLVTNHFKTGPSHHVNNKLVSRIS